MCCRSARPGRIYRFVALRGLTGGLLAGVLRCCRGEFSFLCSAPHDAVIYTILTLSVTSVVCACVCVCPVFLRFAGGVFSLVIPHTSILSRPS